MRCPSELPRRCEYNGRSGYCEYRAVCGGCRARAFAFTGDYRDEEPFCTYEPPEAAKKARDAKKAKKAAS